MPYTIETDKKWQKRWADSRLYSFHKERADKKLYCLEMFSYPSAAKIHVGHWYNFGLTDSYARFKRMQGWEVFHPMGFDAFGLPAENYAISTGIHPRDSTYGNIETMRAQLREMGATFDWDYTLATCDPEYYKWNQWLFLKLYERGLAYRKLAPVNWCPKCQTVLANEQVIDGQCERCSSEVTKKNLTQWFFKITDYAQELLDFLPALNWPEKTKKIQQNWIGRSEGAEIEFSICGSDLAFRVFTTRADTLYGATYVVLAPESPLVDEIVTPECRESVEKYREEAKRQSDIDRMSTAREKTGAPTGAFAINPVNGEKIPVWVADYVLAGYGTGCVMAVPGHDERDFEFAQKFSLPIIRVIKGAPDAGGISCVSDELPFVDDGFLVNSAEFDGFTSEDARRGIVNKLAAGGKAEFRINYKLRDWLVSRQRYWGTPIPIIHCDSCGADHVPEADLPVRLPYDVEFTPDGESPLKKCEEYMNAPCPLCGKPARRDPDTLDTFVCSSWYFLRYLDNKNGEKPFDTCWIDKMAPVDIYVGGPEHAAMHLLYARFITKALRDIGCLHFDEPFTRLVHQGMILGPDGSKMSKSAGNTVSPDDYIAKHGADIFRMYLGFGFAYSEGGPWSDDGIKAIARFISRVERMAERVAACCVADGLSPAASPASSANLGIPDNSASPGIQACLSYMPDPAGLDAAGKELNYQRNYSIKHAGADIERFQFNTAISRAMELLNALYKYDSDMNGSGKAGSDMNGSENAGFGMNGSENAGFGIDDFSKDARLFAASFIDLVRVIAPFAPHFCEDLWESLGLSGTVFASGNWPQYSEASLKKDAVEMAVQVNGTVRFRIEVPQDADDAQIEAAAKHDARLPQFLTAAGRDGAPARIVKVIVIKGRLVSIVAK